VNPPSREAALTVFSQRADARIDVDGWNAHAMRFFATRIGLTADKRYPVREGAPGTDEAVFVVAPNDEPAGLRSTFARPCEPDDYALAEAADAAGSGLALLARRCGMVWFVVREHAHLDVVREHAHLDVVRKHAHLDVPREHDAIVDRLALRLATILASILLGPILDVAAGELFGVKTARAKLEASRTASP
jgi:hypothetical protein